MGKPIPDNIKGLIYKLEPGCKEQQIALKNLSVFLSKEGLTLRDVIAFRDDLDMHKEDAAKAKIYVKEIERAFEENDQALKEAKQQFEEAKNKAFKVIEDRDKIIKDREQQVADLEKRLTTASQEKQTLAGQKTQLEREIKNLKSSGSNAVGRKALLITFAMAASFVVGGILFSEKVPKKTIAQETQQEPSAQQDPFTKPTDSKRIFHNINYYISRDNVSLWATIIRGKGVQQISTLSIGERVFVQLPNERHRIHPQNKWVHISLLNGQEGYVLSKNLSYKRPSHDHKTLNDKIPTEQNYATPQAEPTENHTTKQGQPFKREVTTAYICRSVQLSGSSYGYPLYVNPTTQIKACASYISLNHGKNVEVALCSYPNDTDTEHQAKIFLNGQTDESFYAPYSAVSLERSTCTQKRIIKAISAEP